MSWVGLGHSVGGSGRVGYGSPKMDLRTNHTHKQAQWSTVADVELWCRSHGLKLNANKSDVIWLGTRQQLAMISQADKDLRAPSERHCRRQRLHARNVGRHSVSRGGGVQPPIRIEAVFFTAVKLLLLNIITSL